MPKIPKPEDLPKGRPLWLSELRKQVPSGANYDIENALGSKRLIHKTRATLFSNSYDKYKRTCDIQPDIKVFNANADTHVNT